MPRVATRFSLFQEDTRIEKAIEIKGDCQTLCNKLQLAATGWVLLRIRRLQVQVLPDAPIHPVHNSYGAKVSTLVIWQAKSSPVTKQCQSWPASVTPRHRQPLH